MVDPGITSGNWTAILQIGGDVLKLIGAFSIFWAILWTALKPFTRERLYGILRSDFGSRSGFVLGVITDTKHRNTVAKVVMDSVSDQENKHRLRALISDLFAEEREENRKAREMIRDVARLAGDAVTRSAALEDMCDKLIESKTATERSNAVASEAMKNMTSSVTDLKGDVARLSEKVDRTQEMIINIKVS